MLIATAQMDWSNVAAAIVALAAFIVSIVSLLYAKTFNRSQAMIDFHRRFDDLTKAKYEAIDNVGEGTTPSGNPKIAGFIMRYWDMHYAEFVFWKQKLLKKEIYKDWLETLHHNRSLPMIEKTTYAEAWAYVKKWHRFSDDFTDFMDSIFDKGAEATLNDFKNRGNQYR
jgi:hypothetical protein